MFQAFSEINFNHLFYVDCDLAIEELHNSLLNLYNQFSPIKTKSITHKDRNKPWINSSLKNMIKRRQNLYILFKLNKISSVAFNRFKNMVTSTIRNLKKSLLSKFIPLH